MRSTGCSALRVSAAHTPAEQHEACSESLLEAFVLLSLSTGEELQLEEMIKLPENVIDGSARGSVSVLGELKKKKSPV